MLLSLLPPPTISPSAFTADDFSLCFRRQRFLPLPPRLSLLPIEFPQLSLLSAATIHCLLLSVTRLRCRYCYSLPPTVRDFIATASCCPRLRRRRCLLPATRLLTATSSVSTLPYCC
ncbi:hypothetical protein GW17_00001279 [Ensete ventricosum]|nr:hypothetical protein GW17_00001279 [Ensete ventricosum]RZS17513.1 hypothetical protein BHM03_00049666 [Ensete ventricosum]